MRQPIAFLVTVLFLSVAAKSYAQNTALDSAASKKSYFYTAKQEIEDMLDGKASLSYERAIFLIENAYWENSIDYKQFQTVLDLHIQGILQIAGENQNKLTGDYNPATIYERAQQSPEEWKKAKAKLFLNWAIFSYMNEEPQFTHERDIWSLTRPHRFKYSYKDPLGTTDWSNTQVISLLDTHQGNCFALASLYKIFADRLGTDAVLCTAPGHIYISHEDEKGIPYNVELSNGSFPGSGTMETLTYTTSEATINNIALRNLDLKQSVALCVVYLAKGYQHKLGIKADDFMLQCAEDALRYDDHNLNAMLLKSEILEERLINENKSFSKLQTEKSFAEYQNLIISIYQLGYREMPLDMKNLLIKGWAKDSTAYILTKDNVPPKYNHSGLANTRYASLSWGLFDEEIPVKPVERFNRTLFDTKLKKITKFDNGQTLYNDYNFDPVAFAWNVDPLAHKFPWQSPYCAFDNSPIWKNDPDGRAGEPVASGNTLTIYSTMVFYGGAANPKLANIASHNIESQWNAAHGSVDYNGKTYNDVKFVVTAQVVSEKVAQDMAASNKGENYDPRLNFARIESTKDVGALTPNHVTGEAGRGGDNSMFLIAEDIVENNTSQSHEYGHGLGMMYHTGTREEFHGIPRIMTTIHTIVDPPYRNEKGLLNQDCRQVTQEDINGMNFGTYKNGVGTGAKVGESSNKLFDKSGTVVGGTSTSIKVN